MSNPNIHLNLPSPNLPTSSSNGTLSHTSHYPQFNPPSPRLLTRNTPRGSFALPSSPSHPSFSSHQFPSFNNSTVQPNLNNPPPPSPSSATSQLRFSSPRSNHRSFKLFSSGNPPAQDQTGSAQTNPPLPPSPSRSTSESYRSIHPYPSTHNVALVLESNPHSNSRESRQDRDRDPTIFKTTSFGSPNTLDATTRHLTTTPGRLNHEGSHSPQLLSSPSDPHFSIPLDVIPSTPPLHSADGDFSTKANFNIIHEGGQSTPSQFGSLRLQPQTTTITTNIASKGIVSVQTGVLHNYTSYINNLQSFPHAAGSSSALFTPTHNSLQNPLRSSPIPSGTVHEGPQETQTTIHSKPPTHFHYRNTNHHTRQPFYCLLPPPLTHVV